MNNRKLTALVAVLLVAGFAAGTLVAQTGTPLGSDTFDDVPTGHWADEAIGWAVTNGITSGVGGGRFDPDGTVTRAQIVTFLHRAVNLLEGNTPTTTTTTTVPTTSPTDPPVNEHKGDGFECWMTNPPGPSTVECDADNFAGFDGLYTSLTVGGDYICAIEYTNRAYRTISVPSQEIAWPGPIRCFGNTPWYWGEDSRTDPDQILPAGDFFAVSAGIWGMCAIRDETQPLSEPSGTLVCWGTHPTSADMTAPQAPHGQPAIGVAVGLYHTCVLWQSEVGGSLYCYINDTPFPNQVIGPFSEVYSRWNSERICYRNAWSPNEWTCWHPDE